MSIQEGCKDCQGHVWSAKEAQKYNELSNEINELEKTGYNLDYLETLKNNRHSFFMSISLGLI